MGLFDKVIASVSPGLALTRARNRAALGVITKSTSHYEAATAGPRGASWRPVTGDADTVARSSRARLSGVARDMFRNTPFAARGQQVIANNVVGDGIIPKVIAPDEKTRLKALEAIEAHIDTVAIDAHGRANLYGLQRLAINAVSGDGEVLIRRHLRDSKRGLALPFQIEVMESDRLDSAMNGTLSNGNEVIEGIEYDSDHVAVAYWIFPQHPGTLGYFKTGKSERVSASDILHIYRQDRPGQRRGISWFASVALSLQDAADHQDAQLMRQKIAACFTAFRVTEGGNAVVGEDSGFTGKAATTLSPGRIESLAPGETVTFANPPAVEGFDEFTRNVLRSVAAGLGITYEALTGDLSGANFSSARMGRMEMDRNVSSWQWLMLIPQMMQPIGDWIVEGIQLMNMRRINGLKVEWVPPHRVLVDPTREIPALAKKVRNGFTSRSAVVRELGYDPERVLQEIKSDAEKADDAKLVFDTDPRQVTGSGQAQAVGATAPFENGANNE